MSTAFNGMTGFGKQMREDKKCALQWCNQLGQSLEEGCRKARHGVWGLSLPTMLSCETKVQALVYGILPSTTAIADYAIGLEN